MQSSFQSLSVDGRLRPSGYGGLRDCVCEQRRQHPGQRDLNEQLQSSFVASSVLKGAEGHLINLLYSVYADPFFHPFPLLLPKKIILRSDLFGFRAASCGAPS